MTTMAELEVELQKTKIECAQWKESSERWREAWDATNRLVSRQQDLIKSLEARVREMERAVDRLKTMCVDAVESLR